MGQSGAVGGVEGQLRAWGALMGQCGATYGAEGHLWGHLWGRGSLLGALKG